MGSMSQNVSGKFSIVGKEANFLGEITAQSTGNAALTKSTQPWRLNLLNGRRACFKLDSGADVTCLPEGHAEVPMQLSSVTDLRCEQHHMEELCYVVRDLTEPLLSRDASVRLHLTQVCFLKQMDNREPVVIGFSEVDHTHSISTNASQLAYSTEPEFAKVAKNFPKLFSDLGTLKGEYRIQLKPGAKPYAFSTPCRVAIHHRQPLPEQLNQMVRDGVIRPVKEPTEWCSGIVVVPNGDGKSIRIRVDLIALNKSVRRCLLTLPSVEEQLASLAGAKTFSKLDANSGFWQIPLSKESSLLTTFITPFERFCFRRLPFGISSAPEYFQSTMNDILVELHGVLCPMDYILVFGESYDEHDECLDRVLNTMA
uniref:Reverse transcriptase domain-containing protein n=1 Tax=Trichuris muris TaxID=70415 RepID=A0A5S6QG18_TRIMR